MFTVHDGKSFDSTVVCRESLVMLVVLTAKFIGFVEPPGDELRCVSGGGWGAKLKSR